MVQAFFIYYSASFSRKYDIIYFNAIAFCIHALAQNIFAIPHNLERLNQ